MYSQIASIVGAVLVLAGYLSLQRGWLGREHRSFHALNFFGSALLTAVAIVDRRAGFILLEGAWALLSLPGLVRARATPEGAGSSP